MDHVVLGKLSEILHVINQIQNLNFRNQQLAKELEAIEAEQETLFSLVRQLEARCRVEVAHYGRSLSARSASTAA
jgi:predicted RNase H-like nuclease (RuvC/YqgF family)